MAQQAIINSATSVISLFLHRSSSMFEHGRRPLQAVLSWV
jgi:hypothetical protein